jgi:hypothetical protein
LSCYSNNIVCALSELAHLNYKIKHDNFVAKYVLWIVGALKLLISLFYRVIGQGKMIRFGREKSKRLSDKRRQRKKLKD